MKIAVVCPCGITIVVKPSRAARTKYCSNVCKYRFRIRPRGLTYKCVNPNPGQFGHGRQHLRGEEHPCWKGDAVGYAELHRWVRRNKGPHPSRCTWCHRAAKTEWANISHEYHRDLDDYVALCRKCHRAHDGEARGAAVRRYGRLR